MRKLLITILLLAITGYGGYYLYSKLNVSTIDVSGKILVSQASNYEINLASSVSSSFDAVIKGTAKNNTSKMLKNVFIKYDIAGETVSATIFDIGPGQTIEFTTKSVRTAVKNPDYSFDGIIYDETSM